MPEKLIDITQPLFECKVFPGDPAPRYTRVLQIPQDVCNLTEMALCVHNGTHIDAPRHFIPDGAGVGSLPLDPFYGACTVADLSGGIVPILERCAERLLFRGDTEITAEIAAAIAGAHIKLIGVESQSVGPVGAPMEVHKILLGAGVILLEGLVLSHVKPGEYILSALPLNLGADCDGSPVRAVLIEG
jgi:arylformamidase